MSINNHSHHPDAIAERVRKGSKRSYLRDWVYGGIDGAVTTFAIISSVEGASFSNKAIIVLGFANILADGFSMAAGNYLGTQSEQEELKHWKRVEKTHIDNHREGEIEEVRQILLQKGYKGDLLEKSLKFITGNKLRWINFMLTEEYGLALKVRSPKKAATATFVSFFVCGAIPLIPFVMGLDHAFLIAAVTTGCVFFLIGSVKSQWSSSSWIKEGLFTLTLGTIANAIAYGIGYFLASLGISE